MLGCLLRRQMRTYIERDSYCRADLYPSAACKCWGSKGRPEGWRELLLSCPGRRGLDQALLCKVGMWFARGCNLLLSAKCLVWPAGERISAPLVRLMKLLRFSFPKGKEKSSKCHGKVMQDSSVAVALLSQGSMRLCVSQRTRTWLVSICKHSNNFLLVTRGAKGCCGSTAPTVALADRQEGRSGAGGRWGSRRHC